MIDWLIDDNFSVLFSAVQCNAQQGDKYSPFLHDAVILYAIALKQTYNKGEDVSDGEAVARNCRGITFRGRPPETTHVIASPQHKAAFTADELNWTELQCMHCSPTSNQLRDADACDQ